MRLLFLGFGAVLGHMATMGPAAAGPLTCQTFRDRLDGHLVAAATNDAEAPVYRETGTGADGSQRFAWKTSNLEGTLTCGSGDAFREFYVALAIASKERFVEQLKRFVAMNGAAVCATNDAPPPACDDAGKLMLQSGLQQMGTAYKKRVSAPSGTASRVLQPHLKADMTVAPTLLTFSLDVDAGSTLDSTSLPLAPPQTTAPP